MTKILSMDIEKKGIDLRRIVFYYLQPIAYMGLIFYMSSQPIEKLQLPEIWNIDKVVHFFEYSALGVLWFRAIKTREKIKSAALIAFTITFLYGISDEIHQYFVPNRNSSVYDAIADDLGAFAGIWFYKRRS